MEYVLLIGYALHGLNNTIAAMINTIAAQSTKHQCKQLVPWRWPLKRQDKDHGVCSQGASWFIA
jgi:hypothetical protein